ncbi:hypothetical protein C8Q80DRAFT_1124618 [Daedaleopsis nitida]|nr:hypothetical protein C8Q80DRAFT_1124618 [Daedaleopsis nitida]
MLPRSQTAKNWRAKEYSAIHPKDSQFPNVERPNGTHIRILNRDPHLPHFYLVKMCTQVKKSWGVKHIFVYLQDSSTKAMEDYYKFVSHMMFPEGTQRGIQKAGFLMLRRGDYIFCRDIHNVLQLWIPSDSVFSQDLVDRMKAACDLGLGLRDERTPLKAKRQNKATWKLYADDILHGRILIGAPSSMNHGVKDNSSITYSPLSQCCPNVVLDNYDRDILFDKCMMHTFLRARYYIVFYPDVIPMLSQATLDNVLGESTSGPNGPSTFSYQVQKNMTTPAASTKITMGEAPCEHMLDREKIIQAATRVTIRSMEVAPEAITDTLKLQADITNLPAVCFEGNYVFPALQLNLAALQTADSLAGEHLKKEFGNFGGKHLDHNDSEGGYPSMVTYGDIAEEEEPGVFIVGDLGVAINLDGFIVINFCGLRFHGGYPPNAAPGTGSLGPTGLRSARLGSAVLPGDHLFVMPPEFTDPKYDSAPVVTNLADWMSSGLYLTTPPAFLKFYYRTFCQLAHHFGRQAPRGSTLRVDYKKLSECFTLTEEDSAEHQPEFWQLHPGSEATSEQFGCTREESVSVYVHHIAAKKADSANASSTSKTNPLTKRKCDNQEAVDKRTSKHPKMSKPPAPPQAGLSRALSKCQHVEQEAEDYVADDEGPVKSKEHARKKARLSAAGTGTRAKSPLQTEQTSKVPDIERWSKRRTKGRKGSKQSIAAHCYQLQFPRYRMLRLIQNLLMVLIPT